ncbi:MAG: DUF6599 family protein [Acidobacteriota bacterium]
MMKQRFAAFAALLLCLCLSGTLFSQQHEKEGFPSLEASAALHGGSVVSDRVYDGSSLWGYIDGGADVYLEYGFDKVRAVKLRIDSITYQIDCYRMNDPASAFGIFSVSAFTCTHDSLWNFPHCLSRYQIQFALGRYYVSIADNQGSARSHELGMEIARALSLPLAETASFTPPSLFTLAPFKPYSTRLKFMKGTLGVQNGYPAWEELMDAVPSYALYLLPIETDRGDLTVAQISFGESDAMKRFIERFGASPADGSSPAQSAADGRLRRLWKASPSSVIVLETTMSSSDASPFIAAIGAFVR